MNTSMMAMAMPNQPTFSIFKYSSGTFKVETLEHCFIQRLTIDGNNPPGVLRAANGLVYMAVYDSRVPQASKVNVIVSFQQHTYGRFAVIRVLKS